MTSRASKTEVIATAEILEWISPIVPTLHARKWDRGEVLYREVVDGVTLLTVRFAREGFRSSVVTCVSGRGGNVRPAPPMLALCPPLQQLELPHA